MASLYDRYRDLLRQAHLAAAKGQRAEALQSYQAAATMLPARAVPRIGIGRMHLALGDADAARAAFLAALAIEPQNEDAREGLKRVGRAGEEPPGGESRRATARPALDHRARPASAYRAVADDPPSVRQAADRWEAAHASGDVEGLLQAAIAFSRAGRPRAATLAVHDALAIDPRQARVYEVAEQLDRRSGRPDGARSLADRLERYRAATDDPDALEQQLQAAEDARDVAGILAVADEHRRRGRPRSAAEAMAAALAIAPGDTGVHLAIARLTIRPGRRVPASVVRSLELLARLIELDGDVAAHRRIAAFVSTALAPAR